MCLASAIWILFTHFIDMLLIKQHFATTVFCMRKTAFNTDSRILPPLMWRKCAVRERRPFGICVPIFGTKPWWMYGLNGTKSDPWQKQKLPPFVHASILDGYCPFANTSIIILIVYVTGFRPQWAFFSWSLSSFLSSKISFFDFLSRKERTKKFCSKKNEKKSIICINCRSFLLLSLWPKF